LVIKLCTTILESLGQIRIIHTNLQCRDNLHQKTEKLLDKTPSGL
jgi:hypothetical protein